MPQVSSIMRLHLSCRVWIAEMNFDINVLRIFDDYLKELSAIDNQSEVKTAVKYFEMQFVEVRKQIDELRHEMHVIKMKLGAYSREKKPSHDNTYPGDTQPDVEKRYLAFRSSFNELKNEFSEFEGRWLE
jgi:hypothetical protein